MYNVINPFTHYSFFILWFCFADKVVVNHAKIDEIKEEKKGLRFHSGVQMTLPCFILCYKMFNLL